MRFVCVGVCLLGPIAAGVSSCGGSSSSPGAEFCQSWATAFCQKLYDCTPSDQRGSDFLGGPSQSVCVQGWAATCSNPQSGQSFDVDCSGAAQVNAAAKSACLNELSTITCDEFNSPDYMSVCTQVCSSGATGGTGGAGTGGIGGSGTGGTGPGTGGTGTGGTGASCGTVEPCGGNLVGTWSLNTACLSAAGLTAVAQQGSCSQEVVTDSKASISGISTFGSDLTYSISENLSFTLTFQMPASCAAGLDCATYGSYLSQSLAPGGSATCSGTTTCACVETNTELVSDSGTYVLSGSNATLTSSVSGNTSTNSYCVQGSTIHLVTVAANQTTIQSDIVGQKQ
ncbi:MAG TPA: hypothetical protein VMT03_08365 [Polyangia bacterium]|nr:hypothetical protein [Polyangia bacterium]